MQPQLWEQVKAEVARGDRGGNPGQWSARKAQLAVQEYKRRGGKYRGSKPADNPLVRWTKQDWLYAGEPGNSRYLPRAAIAHLSPRELDETSRAKRAATRAGLQYSPQPKHIAQKVKFYRNDPSPKRLRKGARALQDKKSQ